MAQASAALVYDTSINGVTSPIRGSRYRFELSQSAGSLRYTGTARRLPDLPHAGPALHVRAARHVLTGGTAANAEDQRLPTLYLGYPGSGARLRSRLVRSRGVRRADRRLVPGVRSPDRQPRRDRERGVALPALGRVRRRIGSTDRFRSSSRSSPTPAWRGAARRRPSFTDGDRNPVSSVGAAVRINLLGFAVAEIDYVRPLDRPGRGWLWQFNLMPGF